MENSAAGAEDTNKIKLLARHFMVCGGLKIKCLIVSFMCLPGGRGLHVQMP